VESQIAAHRSLGVSTTLFITRERIRGEFIPPGPAQTSKPSEAEFRETFRGSPIKRTKWRGLVRNACIALGNAGMRPQADAYPQAVNALGRLSAHPDSVISESARWALSRIKSEGHHFASD
jgi:epoxyqueuosine reductase QueG